MKIFISAILIIALQIVSAQDLIYNTFKTTRVINGHSTDMLWKKDLDLRITHRFGSLAGANGGFKTFYGLDNATDIRIGLEYGITNNLMVGVGRIRGSSHQRQNIDSFIKFRLVQQGKSPVSIVFLGASTYSLMAASTDFTSAYSFKYPTQRWVYASQLLISRKFGERISLQISPTYVHRNYVAFSDQNGIAAVGFSGKVQITKMFGILAEYYYLIPTNRVVDGVTYINPLAIGFEFDTGGHVFHVNFSNSAELGETLFIANTSSKWTTGDFRLGFNISRIFKF